MNRPQPQRRRRVLWQNVLTVFSAAILISAHVFDAAFVLIGIFVMVQFVRAAQRVEPFTAVD